jgi:hypothetical protein
LSERESRRPRPRSAGCVTDGFAGISRAGNCLARDRGETRRVACGGDTLRAAKRVEPKSHASRLGGKPGQGRGHRCRVTRSPVTRVFIRSAPSGIRKATPQAGQRGEPRMTGCSRSRGIPTGSATWFCTRLGASAWANRFAQAATNLQIAGRGDRFCDCRSLRCAGTHSPAPRLLRRVGPNTGSTLPCVPSHQGGAGGRRVSGWTKPAGGWCNSVPNPHSPSGSDHGRVSRPVAAVCCGAG